MHHPPRSASPADSPPASTGTVVIAATDTADIIHNVGTSTITVHPDVTAPQLLACLVAADGSRQRHTIIDAAGTARPHGPVAAGDRLVVAAEDDRTQGCYRLAVYDTAARARDGDYWDHALYEQVDRTVNRHTPVFPDRRYDITAPAYRARIRRATETYAVGNEAGDPAAKDSPLLFRSREVWFYGDALDAAIRDCHAAGGGIVVVPAQESQNEDGAYYTGAIRLLSGVNLRVETGAVVKFMRTPSNAYYPVVLTSFEGTDLYSFSPLVYALGQHDIAVTGGGTLDGQEDMWNWRPWKKGYWGERWADDKDPAGSFGQQGVINRMNRDDLPVEERVFSDDGQLPEHIPVIEDGAVRLVPPPAGARAMRSAFRPSFIQPNHCSNVLIEGIRIRNPPFWTIHPLNSMHVLIRDVDIHSDKTTGFEEWWNNDDGIDPESCRDVVLERNKVTVSDDGVAVKSGRNTNGRRHREPSRSIIIRDSVYRNDGGWSAAVSLGSEASGGIHDVFLHDLTFEGPGLAMGIKIKTNAARGGVIEKLYVRDCVLQRTPAPYGLIEFNVDYEETAPHPHTDVFDPLVRHVYLDNVNTAHPLNRGRTTFSFATSAARSPVRGVHYRNSVFHSSGTLADGFARNKNIADFAVENVTYIDPRTSAVTRYDTVPLDLLDLTEAVTDSGDRIRLAPAGLGTSAVTGLPVPTFTLTGRLDLSSCPAFPRTGHVRLFVDRDTAPVPVQMDQSGIFVSGPVELGHEPYWYRDRHYLAVNLYDGISINTVVYHVTVPKTAIS
ncbi:glycoside hydrolase family 28 protein [Streptomyces sp. NPDC059787]|uniref:glycoside hydrolase family 28 protein n=1 Tax=Streptomyces sp. NPDC059787 TaxID=3346947 RepID=UPI00364EC62A